MAIKNKTILIIDDDNEIIKLMSKVFASLGVTIITAQNLFEAKSALFNSIPHLIFLDIRLDSENGLEFLQFLKTLSYGSSIPVIILSSIDDKKMQEFALKNGAAGYVTKPFETNKLVQVARKHLKTKEENTIHTFKDFEKNPQFLNISADIILANETFIDIETFTKIADGSSVEITSSPFIENIGFGSAKFSNSKFLKSLELGHYTHRLYYVGLDEQAIAKIKMLKDHNS